MRIGTKVILVGAIPIALAAIIAASAIVLSNSADRARSGAVLASTIYRTLLAAVMARDDYLAAEPRERQASERPAGPMTPLGSAATPHTDIAGWTPDDEAARVADEREARVYASRTAEERSRAALEFEAWQRARHPEVPPDRLVCLSADDVLAIPSPLPLAVWDAPDELGLDWPALHAELSRHPWRRP